MQSSGRNLLQPLQVSNPLRIAFLFLAAAALTVLQACSGQSFPNYTAPTAQIPTTGVTLQQIKITPSNSVISLAEARQLFATGVYSDGSSVDISSQVKWNASSWPSATNFVSVTSTGLATASSIGATAVSATIGSVVGLLQLTVAPNGFSTTPFSIVPGLFKNAAIDVAYLPQQTKVQGTYPVQAVNLDADQFASVLPPPVALKASIPMPAGFIPNTTAASLSFAKVAVISYTSPNVQIIDVSTDPNDVATNTVIATFAAPISQTVTVNGTSCMICGALVNPLNNLLILSTAQGFYSMDFTSGKFIAIPFSPSPLPATTFSLNPSATQPYILSSQPAAGEVQILNLSTNAVTTISNVTSTPASAAIDLTTSFGAVADDITGDQALLDLTDPQNPQISVAPGLPACAGGSPFMNMVSMGVSASAIASNASHTLFTSQTAGNCVGFAVWPNPGAPLQVANIYYGYGPMPAAPDGSAFANGSDPNAIATFTSVLDKKNYGVLVDANQQWIAKVNLASVIAFSNMGAGNSPPLPGGLAIPPADIAAGQGGDAVTFLPTPSTSLVLSTNNINFGSVAVGTQSPTIIATLSNIGAGTITPQITLQGANAGDFSYQTTCAFTLLTQSNCAINFVFAPTAAGARSASLTVSSSGVPTLTLPLTGSGS